MTDRPQLSYPRFFNAEELGKSLKEVATDLMATPHKEIISRWFHSAKDADLFIWMDINHNVIKQQLSFYGQVVEWNVVEGVKTGLIIEDESRVEGVNSSDVVRFDLKPQKAPVEQALDLLNHITALKEEERQALRLNFEQAQASTTMPPEMFIERFGKYLSSSEPPPKPKPSLWARVKAWLKR